eukprot:5065419-Alexandrium_andersonii.AAC.1
MEVLRCLSIPHRCRLQSRRRMVVQKVCVASKCVSSLAPSEASEFGPFNQCPVASVVDVGLGQGPWPEPCAGAAALTLHQFAAARSIMAMRNNAKPL